MSKQTRRPVCSLEMKKGTEGKEKKEVLLEVSEVAGGGQPEGWDPTGFCSGRLNCHRLFGRTHDSQGQNGYSHAGNTLPEEWIRGRFIGKLSQETINFEMTTLRSSKSTHPWM